MGKCQINPHNSEKFTESTSRGYKSILDIMGENALFAFREKESSKKTETRAGGIRTRHFR